MKDCYPGGNCTGLIANIIALFPDLEVLSLEGCYTLSSGGYHLIAHLRKLSELNLSYCQVYYTYVKLSETCVCIYESV